MADIAYFTDYASLTLADDGRALTLADRRTGENYLAGQPPFSTVKVAGRAVACTQAAQQAGKLTLGYGETGVKVVLGVRGLPHYLILSVLEATGPAEELTLCELPLTLQGRPDEPFAACALALDLQTNVLPLPGPMTRLAATCYPRFGMVGAEVALIGCPTAKLRGVIQEAVSASPGLPHSRVGGPWALEGPLNRTSYVFNFGGLNAQTADAWIERAKSLGFNQVQIHGGGAFRFGDCALDPTTYPGGLADVKAMTDKLHAAGIHVGMQPYAFFIDKRCPWVTPKPDPRLASDATLTLAADLPADAAEVPVVESTASMSAITGFFVRNSATLMVGQELITYQAVGKQAPFGFTGCTRGAYGTAAAAHAKGVPVRHLKECFGLFVPDPDTTLLEEVAAKTAELFSEGGFDCIYLDALDGEDVLGGAPWAWHYGSRYAFEVWKRLKRPAVIEYSTIHHHLWYLRSRMGAWDYPNRGDKKFIDMHVQGNAANDRVFIPSNLGWWALRTWGGPNQEPTFFDDIEYLCTKAIGTDTGLSLVGYDPAVAAHRRLAEIIRRYENVRHAGTVSEAVKAEFRQAGREFSLIEGTEAAPRFRRMQYHRHRIEQAERRSNTWRVGNEFTAQPLALRIEALVSCSPYDAENARVILDLADTGSLNLHQANNGVTLTTEAVTDPVKVGDRSARLTAASTLTSPTGAWAQVGRLCDPALDLGANQALGVWVYGDGQGELLNFQLTSPQHIVAGIADHYLTVDFRGWRYFELVEPEGERWAQYTWPYGDAYSIFRELVYFPQIAGVSVWVNNLPPNAQVACCLSPIRALPVVPVKLSNPTVTVGGKSIRFPVEMETGSYLEYLPPGPARLYGPKGDLLSEVQPDGTVTLAAGENELTFTCDGPPGLNLRARVTTIGAERYR
jgi:hypothetical protein